MPSKRPLSYQGRACLLRSSLTLERVPTPAASHRLELLVRPISPHDVKPLLAHRVARKATEVVSDQNDKVRQHQDAALEVVTLPFTIDVAEQEHAQNNRDHVPLREEQAERVQGGVGVLRDIRVDGGEEDEARNLEKAHLECVG